MAQKGHRYILGNMPPPIGGVSTFMHRHVSRRKAAGEDVTVCDWVRMNWAARALWILRLLADPRPLHLEFNAYESWSMLAARLRPFPARILLRVHSGGPESRLKPGRKRIFRNFLRSVDTLVLVGPHVEGVLKAAGFSLPIAPKIEPAFLPPPPEDEIAILETYGPKGRAFLKRSPLLVLQGSDTLHGGVDLYGSDLATRALLALRKEFPDIGLVIGRPTRGNEHFQAYCAQLDREVATAGAMDHVWVLDGERELWPIISRASVFLRPTTSDGDSISVREALHFGVPVVASNAAPRPQGVHLFESRDLDDFLRAIRLALSTHPEVPCS